MGNNIKVLYLFEFECFVGGEKKHGKTVLSSNGAIENEDDMNKAYSVVSERLKTLHGAFIDSWEIRPLEPENAFHIEITI